jgi:hypothetical protein
MMMIAVALLISTIDTSHLYLTVGSLDGKAKQSVGNDSMTGFAHPGKNRIYRPCEAFYDTLLAPRERDLSGVHEGRV